MTPEAKVVAEKVLQALGRNPMDFGGYIANERLGKEECIKAMIPAIAHALAEARREGLEDAAHHHQPGCPTIADDDSDSVLDDYMECCCEKDELRIWCRAQAQGGGG